MIKAMIQGEARAVELLRRSLPGLHFDAADDGYWVWGAPLTLGADRNQWRTELASFTRSANTIIALSDAELRPILTTGAVQIEDGHRRDHVLLAETGRFESTFFPATITLSGRGGGPAPRPLAARAADLCASQPRFEKAANIFAAAGQDLRELYKVAELIAAAHGRPGNKAGAHARDAFYSRIEILERDWMALHRSARPHRHAEPHIDLGPVLSPKQARYLLQHALKLWLEREVPV